MCESPEKGSDEETFGRKLHQADLQPVIERTFHLTLHIWAFHSQVFPHGWAPERFLRFQLFAPFSPSCSGDLLKILSATLKEADSGRPEL